MAGTPKRLILAALTNVYTTNIYNQASALVYTVITKIRVVNKHASVAAKFRLFVGATGANAAGTELAFDKQVAVGDAVEIFCRLRLDSTDFLVGGSDTATALTIEIEGELVAA